MTILEGYLTETEAKSGKTKKGRPYTSYRGQIQDKWYSFGFDKPGVAKGDYVKAEVGEVNGYEQIIRAERIDPPTKASGPAAGGPQRAAGPAGDRQDSIVYQSSRKDALALVELLVSQDALPISVAKTSAGKAKRYEEIMALVDKLTVQYFYDVTTLRNLERVADAGADGPAPEALPEDAQGEPEPAEPETTDPKGDNW